MDNTLDVGFGEEDGSMLMVSVIAGATVISLFASWLITKFCINKVLTARISVIEGKLGITPVTNIVPAPAK